MSSLAPGLATATIAQPGLAQVAAPLPQINNSQYFAYNGIIFDELQFEVPENLELAWRTLGGVEDIPSSQGVPAQRVAQTLGVVMSTIKFKASFIGPNAVTKARTLESLQKAQSSGPFQFGARIIQCTIFGLTESYYSINDITYTIELEPTIETTNGSPAAGAAALSSLNTALSAIGSAQITDPQILALTAVPPAISLAKSTNVFGAALSTFQNLSTQFQSATSQLNTLMAAKAGSTLAADTSTFLSAAGLAGSLSTAVQTISSLTGSTGTSVPVAGANLYQLAARYTGDINNVDTIMSANGVTDPFNPGVTSILIPGLLKAL